MDKETWSIAISLIGLLLGLLSAHAQLKAVGRWALKTGGEKARAWVKRMNDDAELYATSPSAFVAFLIKEAYGMAIVVTLTIAALGVLGGETLPAPTWVRRGILLVSMLWIGNKLADVSNLIDLTLRKARSAHRRSV